MLVKCKICGKEFEAEKTAGRVSGFCSEECRRKARTKVNTKSLLKRYHNDEEFRKKRIADNVIGNRKRREARKEQAMQELCEELYNAKSSGDIRAILEKKVRIKSQYYA
jgi:hypothetical protein